MQLAQIQVLETSHISLHRKHKLIANIHEGPAYDKDCLRSRVNEALDEMIACGTFRADTLTDVTADNVRTSALETLLEIKAERKSEIDVRVASYSPLGFKDCEPDRWEVFEAGARQADFISALPEADDQDEYPDHIGFEEHCKRMLELSVKLNIPIHVHTDQRNEPSESGTERLIEVVRRHGGPQPVDGQPQMWVVHMVSPSTYEEQRFETMVQALLDHHIGVICCPSAAVGMRQLRPIQTPTYNSIPRVLDLMAAGVPVRLACDNIADICSPSTTADLTDEVFVLSAALRFYNIDILAKLAAGVALSASDVNFIRDHLAADKREIQKVIDEIYQETDSV
ncbi:MAG: hypothetical protein AAF571_13130 [Verrucomicrobiota bacterium]